MKKTLLVDANNLLKHSFHGNTTTYTDFGYIGALVTFYTIIRKMIKEQKITKVILFWDGLKSGRLRYDIYPEYKSNRDKNWYGSDELILSDKDISQAEAQDQSLLIQRSRIQQYAEELFFRQVEDPVVEADDNIAYYILNHREEDELCIIYSNDRDFCQLIDKNVELYLVNKKQMINKNNYFMYFDHHLKNSALIKAIEGCTADVIHGVERCGEKTLLKHFPELITTECTFDHLYNRAVEINKSRKKPLIVLENLINGKTAIDTPNVLNGKHLFELNYKLVNLREPFVTEESVAALESAAVSPMDTEGRGGKNLLRLMYEDGFINSIPGGPDGYRNFLIEFVPVVNAEKELFKEYKRKSN